MPTSTQNPDGTYTLKAAPAANPTANPNYAFQVPQQTPTLPTVPPPASSTMSVNAMGAQPYNLAPTTPLPPVAVAPQVQAQPQNGTQTGQTQGTQQPQQTGVADNLNNIFTSLTGKDAATNTAVTQATSPYEKQLNDINIQLATQQANAIAHQEAAMRSGETLGYASREAQNVQRTDAIETLKLSAQQAGLQGDITRAEKLATAAVDAQFAQKQQDLENAKTNIYNNYDTFTAAEKKQADAALLRIDANDAFVKQQKEDQSTIFKVALTASQYGADSKTLQDIQNASSPQEALQLAGQYTQDPKAQYELKSAMLDNQLKQIQISTAAKQLSLLGEPTAAEKKAQAEAISSAKASLPAMQDKLTLVDTLKESSGLNTRVGTSVLTRKATDLPGAIVKGTVGILSVPGTIADKFSGAGQDFAAGVHNLVNGMTLQNLIDAKARGATFGALSEGELSLLASSATKINDWEIKDSKGQGTGVWNIDQNSFNKELDNIKNLTNRAILQSQGTIFSSDEQSALNQAFAPLPAGPSAYFQ